MDDFGRYGHYSYTSPHSVYFSKPALCEGESFKVVASSEKSYDKRQFRLKLFSLSDNRSADFMRESVLSPLRQDLYSNYYYHEDPTVNDALLPGSYLARVLISSPLTTKESTHEELLGEHSFQIIELDDYKTVWEDAFGGEWDESVYLDTQEPLQLNSFFVGWLLDPLSDYEISERGKRTEIPGISPGISLSLLGGDTSLDPVFSLMMSSIWRPGYEGSVIKRLNDFLRQCISEGEQRPPFSLFTSGRDVEVLPHVDLTKLFWLINVIGPSLMDAMFFTGGVTLTSSTNHDSLSIALTANDAGGEQKLIMPPQEPPIFRIVRGVLEGAQNLDLVYDASKGIDVVIRANRSPLRFSVGQH